MLGADIHRLRAIDGIKWSKYGSEVLPAWVADMDFTPPGPVRRAVTDMVERGDLGYNLVASDRLVPTWVEWQHRHHGWRPDERHCHAFTGTLHALEALMVLDTRPGDGVVLFTPIYQPFRAAVEDSGRRVVDVPLDGPDWRIDGERLEAAIDSTTRVVLFCQPHNPLGRVFDVDELASVADVAARHDLLVISDEIWADLVHEPAHLPLAHAVPALADRCVTIGSASKTFNIAGLRCAVAHVGPPHLRSALADFPGHLIGSPSTVGAAATVAAWTECDDWLDTVRARLRAGRDHLLDRVAADLPGVRMHRPEATYLAWLDFGDTELADNPSKVLYTQAKVALEPGWKFGPQSHAWARLNFATSAELLDEIVDRIAGAL